MPAPRDLSRTEFADAALSRVLWEGVRGSSMPGWHELPANDLRALAAHVRSLESGRPHAKTEPSLSTEELVKVENLYVKNCATCHGPRGRGDGTAAGALAPKPTDFWQERPSLAYALDVLAGGVPGTAMPPWSDRVNAADRRLLALRPLFLPASIHVPVIGGQPVAVNLIVLGVTLLLAAFVGIWTFFPRFALDGDAEAPLPGLAAPVSRCPSGESAGKKVDFRITCNVDLMSHGRNMKAALRLIPDSPTEASMARECNDYSRREILRAIGAASLLGGVASADEPEKSVPEQLVNALNALFGKHPGFRSAHAKGIMCEGEFTPAASAATLSKAPHLRGDPVKVTVRFSDSTGVPDIPDGVPEAGPRGMAVRFQVPGGGSTDIVANAFNGFAVATGEDFLAFLKAVTVSGKDAPKPTPLEKFLASHPKAMKVVTAPKPSSGQLRQRALFQRQRLRVYQCRRQISLWTLPAPPRGGEIPRCGGGRQAAAQLLDGRAARAAGQGTGQFQNCRAIGRRATRSTTRRKSGPTAGHGRIGPPVDHRQGGRQQGGRACLSLRPAAFSQRHRTVRRSAARCPLGGVCDLQAAAEMRSRRPKRAWLAGELGGGDRRRRGLATGRRAF